MHVIVAGGNQGKGLATAQELCRMGHTVVITARNPDRAQDAINTIKKEVPDAKVSAMMMELKELSSVRAFADAYLASGQPLHILINNAGIMCTPHEITTDGFEAQFQVNHLGHFLLTHYMLPLIQRSGGGRVINLSSRAHMRWRGPLDLSKIRTITAEEYGDGWISYGLSKLANILFTRSLALRTPESVSTYSLHPGLVDTKLLDVSPGLQTHAISIQDGIRTVLFLAAQPASALRNGEYYFQCEVVVDGAGAREAISATAQSLEDAEILWQASLSFVGLKDEEYGK